MLDIVTAEVAFVLVGDMDTLTCEELGSMYWIGGFTSVRVVDMG